MQITYDGVSLMGSVYRVDEWDIENISNRSVDVQELAATRGAVMLDDDYSPKKFSIKGTIMGDTSDQLEQRIEELKELLQRKNRNLDYEYAGGLRRLIATGVSFKCPRKSSRINVASFSADFVAPDGVAYDTDLTTETVATVAVAEYVGDITIGGNIKPDVETTITIIAATTMTKFELLAGGFKTSVSGTFVAGDVIVINEEELRVTVNGAEVAYTGMFPHFDPGINLWQANVTGSGIQYSISFKYKKCYV